MDPVSVAVRLREVRERAAAAARRAGRSPSAVVLVAIGKGHPARTLEEARAAGQTVFGESRGQELVSKCGAMSPGVEWHFVGPLQTNKVRMVRPRVALLHSFDRDRLVRPWTRGEAPAPPALLQVNIGMEPQKQGVPPDLVIDAFERWTASGVGVSGLMAIPPMAADPEAARPYFALMRRLRDDLSARVGTPLLLSMGMTDDFEAAIEEGSTMIRVGRAIFGSRPTTE